MSALFKKQKKLSRARQTNGTCKMNQLKQQRWQNRMFLKKTVVRLKPHALSQPLPPCAAEPIESILRSPIFLEDQIVGSARHAGGVLQSEKIQPMSVCGRDVEVLQRPVRPHLLVQDKQLGVAGESAVHSSIATFSPCCVPVTRFLNQTLKSC